ncbi:hypothetical protein ACFQFH_19975 [Halobaculum halobium]|uniref:hypothetical protein n=1 Tax=Halobaculum halobium TaxID=3032281 RepID=UPI003618608B
MWPRRASTATPENASGKCADCGRHVGKPALDEEGVCIGCQSDDEDDRRLVADGGQVVEDDRENELAQEPAEEARVSFTTAGDPLRSFLRYPAPLVDECVAVFDDDGLQIKAVDAPNVGMVDASFPAEGFSRYTVSGDEDQTGVNLKRLRKTLKWARKGRGSNDGDPVVVDVFDRRIRVRIVREDTRMTRRSEWFAIDPNNMRPRPSFPGLDLPNRARPSIDALGDAVAAIDSRHDYVRVTRDGETLVLESRKDADPDDDTTADRVTMLGCAWDTRDDGAEACSSLFSMDYLADMVDALNAAKADDVTLKWGDEFPTVLQFHNEDWGHEGRFMLAPRIETDEDEP